jgi:CheY-like chemotaxis protein
MMGGTITVQSAVGQGSTFRFRFPNVTITELGELKPAAGPEAGDFSQFAPAVILVADDVALNRQLVAGYFEGTAHRLLYANDGREALALAEQHQPAVILMDMRMPELNGYEATRLLKANPALQHIPVIAVTASSFREEEARARTLCEGFIRKPFTRAELVAELQKFLQPAAAAARPVSEVSPGAPAPAAAATVPAELLAQWPELVARLRSEESEIWPELCDTLELKPIEDFATRLRSWGESYGAAPLCDYAAQLLEQAQQYDLDRLPQTLAAFQTLIATLAEQARRAADNSASSS